MRSGRAAAEAGYAQGAMMVAVPFNMQCDITDVAVSDNVAHVDLWYPRVEGNVQFIHIGLMDVRAADGIRLHYDFERDGFVVEQPKPHLVKKENYYEDHEEWIEVGFFQSWRFNNRPDLMPTKAEYDAADVAAEKKG